MFKYISNVTNLQKNGGGSSSSRTSSYKVGPYTLSGSLLGLGSCSKVYKCRDEDGIEYAMKVIKKKVLMGDAALLKQFYQEITIGCQLEGRHIVPFVNALESKKFYFLVMPILAGGELFDKIVREGSFDESLARLYFQQLLVGLYFLQFHNLAHRDLKPENLLLDSDENLFIADFGTIRDQKEDLLLTVCGTPNYTAPEVLIGCGYNGLAADIWSCGVILYVMLEGRLPFDDDDDIKLTEKIANCAYERLDRRKYSPELLHLMDQLLMVDPKKRITIDKIVVHPWFVIDFDPADLRDIENGTNV